MAFNPKKQHHVGRVAETSSGFVAVIVNEWEGKEPTVDFRRFYINSEGNEAPTQKGFSIPSDVGLLDDLIDSLEDVKELLTKLKKKAKVKAEEKPVKKVEKTVKKVKKER